MEKKSCVLIFVMMLVSLTVEAQIKSDNKINNQEFTVNGVTFKMIYVQGGTFSMGDSYGFTASFSNNEPAHSVTLSDFFIGETEVTQALWTAVMGENPPHFKGDSLPVNYVSWDDCQKFIKKLNSLTGKAFRLPTEAEWEYAARGGNHSRGYCYAGSGTLSDVAWFDGLKEWGIHPVKGKISNELGLYDMSGNVAEWCQDWYSDDYYIVSPSDDPTGPPSPDSWKRKVLRGSGYTTYYTAGFKFQVDYRESDLSTCKDTKSQDVGFRLALVHPSNAQKKTTEAKRQEKKMKAERASLIKAKEMLIDRQYAEALPLLKANAEKGIAVAQCKLGDMYLLGEGVVKDSKEALKWYTKAADQGFAEAQCHLGEMYEEGNGVPQDYTEASKWYTKAAQQGITKASYRLGEMYFYGNGASQDYNEALKWYSKAAEQKGHPLSQYTLGMMYEQGLGVSQDYYEAVKWYKKVADQGNYQAQNKMGLMYYEGKGVLQDYYEAAKWFVQAASGGYANAQYNLGYMFENGKGVSKNYYEAVKWYRKAASQDDESAKKALERLGKK